MPRLEVSFPIETARPDKCVILAYLSLQPINLIRKPIIIIDSFVIFTSK